MTRDDLFKQLMGTGAAEAMAIVKALEETAHLKGDVCEFGVAQGATSALIAHEIMASESHLHLFDSFVGLPPPTDADELLDDIFKLGNMGRYAGTMACSKTQVLDRLYRVGFPRERTHIHEGYLCKTLREPGLPVAVRFAYVDLDLYESTREALEMLTNVAMVVGGIAIVDDYGFFSRGVEKAVGEVVKRGGWRFEMSEPASEHFCILRKL